MPHIYTHDIYNILCKIYYIGMRSVGGAHIFIYQNLKRSNLAYANVLNKEQFILQYCIYTKIETIYFDIFILCFKILKVRFIFIHSKNNILPLNI